jgi:hypothetical protein
VHDLDQCIEAFVVGRDMARRILADEIESLRVKASETKESTEQPIEAEGLFSKK